MISNCGNGFTASGAGVESVAKAPVGTILASAGLALPAILLIAVGGRVVRGHHLPDLGLGRIHPAHDALKLGADRGADKGQPLQLGRRAGDFPDRAIHRAQHAVQAAPAGFPG